MEGDRPQKRAFLKTPWVWKGILSKKGGGTLVYKQRVGLRGVILKTAGVLGKTSFYKEGCKNFLFAGRRGKSKKRGFFSERKRETFCCAGALLDYMGGPQILKDLITI